MSLYGKKSVNVYVFQRLSSPNWLGGVGNIKYTTWMGKTREWFVMDISKSTTALHSNLYLIIPTLFFIFLILYLDI